MIKQFQTRSQQIIMLVVLLALVIAIATRVKAETCTAKQDETLMQHDEAIFSRGRSLASELKDFSWSPVVSFFTTR